MFPNKYTILRIAAFAVCLCGMAAAQSTDQNFPTPLTTNEANGTIKARDLGDSRVTTYFYAFDGGQGDIFINALTKNFSGDIDVFTADSMTPLAKMVIYSETDTSETGRLVYLRKPERLLLRVQGRTLNDDPASFRIKFGGSFIALEPQKEAAPPTVAKREPNEPGVIVNDAGKIVAIVPRPKPAPKLVEPPSTVAKEKPGTEPATGGNASAKERAAAKTATAKAGTVKKPAPRKPAEKGTVFENDTAKVTVATPSEPKAAEREPTTAPRPAAKTPAKKPTAGRNTSVNERAPKTEPRETEPKKPEPQPKSADPLASVRLVIQMKDGTTFWMAMNEVVRFTVDKGVMTVVAKNGSITRYNILDVEKTTIQ